MRASSLLIGLWLLVATPALAAEAVLLPVHPLSGDGAHVHTLRLFLLENGQLVHGLSELHALHGAVVGSPVPQPDGGFAVRYRPPRVKAPESDTLKAVVDGRPLEVKVALEPPARTQLVLGVSPDPLLIGGKSAQAEVRLSARDPAGRPVRTALRAGASVGKLSSLVETAPGEYRATYTPPNERYPQVAIVAALSLADGAFTAVPLKLSARVPVTGVGEPGGSMQILVDGKPFGPEPIDANGRFTVNIVVPPGGRAVGVSTDAAGNQRRRDIDLLLPSFPRLVLAAVPNELPADGRAHAEVVAFAVDPRGNPERNRAPQVVADRGTLSSPQPHGDGLWSWTFTAPTGAPASSEGKVTLHAAGSATRIALRPSPPFRIELIEREPLGAGATEPQQLLVSVLDANDSPVPGARLEASLVGGRVMGIRELEHGLYAVSVVPPKDPGRGATGFHVELRALQAGAPRRVTLHVARAPEGRVAAEAWVDDDLGLPVPNAEVTLEGPDGRVTRTTDAFGTARIELARPAAPRYRVTAEVAALPGLGAALDFVTLGDKPIVVPSVAGRGVVMTHDTPPGASLDADVALHPAAPVDLRLAADSAEARPGQPLRVHVKLRSTGKAPADAIVFQASGGTLELSRPLDKGEAELRFTAPADARPGSRYLVSVTEPRSRVTAFVEVRVP